jgi:hypothetical protein
LFQQRARRFNIILAKVKAGQHVGEVMSPGEVLNTRFTDHRFIDRSPVTRLTNASSLYGSG